MGKVAVLENVVIIPHGYSTSFLKPLFRITSETGNRCQSDGHEDCVIGFCHLLDSAVQM